MPKVSVVMAVRNGEKYLDPSVNSILSQRLEDLELILIDDASTDSSLSIMQMQTDKRVRLLTNSTVMGLAASLNRGIKEASGIYIARMDHDDISLPERLAAQASFLDRESSVDLVGCWPETISEGWNQTWKYPEAHDEIHSELIFSPTLVHSSVIWRRERFDTLGLMYNPELKQAQDFDLWDRAATKGIRFANIPRVLIRYRLHAGQVGRQFEVEQQAVAEHVRNRQISRLGLEPSKHQMLLHHEASRWQFPQAADQMRQLEAWFLALRDANAKAGLYDTIAFGETLERRWLAACKSNVRIGREAWSLFRDSELNLGRPSRAKAVLKTKAWVREVKRKLL